MAESLFADYGINNVSTRQIGSAIGSSNNTVVAYHFGGKDKLIEAIYRHRLPVIDGRRGELLAQADAAGKSGEVSALLNVLWLPLFEQTNQSGKHNYARFLGELLRAGLGRTRSMISSEFPATVQTVSRIEALMPPGFREFRNARWHVATNMILTLFSFIDHELGGREPEAQRCFEDTIAMATAALTAPAASG